MIPEDHDSQEDPQPLAREPRPPASLGPRATLRRPRLRTGHHQQASWAAIRTPQDLGRFLTRRRVARGWTQQDLAQHLGFPVRYLHEIESGKDTRAYVRLFTLLRTLDIDLQLSHADTSDVDFNTAPDSEEPGPPPSPPSTSSSSSTSSSTSSSDDGDVEDWDF